MYPLPIVHDTIRIYRTAFRQFAREFNAQALALVEKSTKSDTLLALALLSESVQHDADIFTWLADLRARYGDNVPKDKFQKQLEVNAQHVNAFSRAQFMRSIQAARQSLNSPKGAPRAIPQPPRASMVNQPAPVSQPPQVPMVDMTRGENVAAHKVTDFVRGNIELIDNLAREHAEKIIEAVRDGVIHGKSRKEIAEQITTETGKSERQAEFWAEDQAGNLFADLTKERQLSAGAPGYIWRTMKDRRTRDKHSHLEGTYHRWDKPPAAGSSNYRLHVHPGQDYRCRCYAEMAWGPEDAERELNPDRLAVHMEKNRIGK